MKRKVIHDISASSIQVIINQISGIVVFYMLSKYLSKQVFGEISWCLAVLMVSFAILGFGIDQLVVKKTAAGNEPDDLATLHSFHVLLTGITLLLLLGLIVLFTGRSSPRSATLLLLAAGQFLIFLSIPFKQIANGKEAYRALLCMSVGANIVKVAGMLVLAGMGSLTSRSFVLVYILASAVELILCLVIGIRWLKLRPALSPDWTRYKALVRESMPQLGVILCNAGIARFDWILLGLITTTSVLAEYSFAYKVFEMSTLPLLIIAPLMLPRITKWFNSPEGADSAKRDRQLLALAKYELIFSCFGSLLLNIIWSPLLDSITGGKYGRVNQWTILILSACVPLLYINNILWSVNFASHRMKLILAAFTTTFIITCAGDLILIPIFHAEGAALAFLVAMGVQTAYFIRKTRLASGHRIPHYLLLSMGNALISGLLAKYCSDILWTQITIAVPVYLCFIFFSRQFRVTDFFNIKKLIWT